MRLGERIGRNLRGGETVELVSDLGGGKTSFVKGLAKGMGSIDTVHSPSFTITNTYKGQDLTLRHFDFYRLIEAGIMKDELAELVNDPKVVLAIEWGDIVNDILPNERLTIKITATGEDTRELTLTHPLKYAYLFKENS